MVEYIKKSLRAEVKMSADYYGVRYGCCEGIRIR